MAILAKAFRPSSKMKKLHLGKFQNLENDFRKLRRDGFLYIAPELPDLTHIPVHEVFDVTLHGINLFKELNYRTSEAIVNNIDALFPRGDGTLTKDTGLEFIAECLEDRPRSFDRLIPKPDKKSTPGHIWAYNRIRRILRSPVLNRVLSSGVHNKFAFRDDAVVVARINPAELTSFDARALIYFLITVYKGQLVIADFRYAHDMHVDLLLEDRLVFSLRSLSQIKKQELFHDETLLISDIEAHGVLYKDAVVLAEQKGLRPDPDHTLNGNPYNDFIDEVMA
jgi:hypothetical protein